MLTIRATDAGFHTLSPLGTALAPNVFLRTGVNVEGTILLAPETGTWVSEESLNYASSEIAMQVTAAELAGERTQVTVTEVTYFRVVGGEKVIVGEMQMGMGMVLDAYHGSAGGEGKYTLYADAADTLDGLIRQDGFRFKGGNGDDVFAAHTDTYPIYGRVHINGHGGDDVLHGSLANDVIKGGRGDDVLVDLSGENLLRGGRGNDVIDLGVWSDESTAKGGRGDDVLTSSNGDDELRGGRGDDYLYGNRGDDFLEGNRGDDHLFGGDGQDRLRGSAGDDVLTGGMDADLFVFRVDQAGHDRITDFDVYEDMIAFRDLGNGYAALEFASSDDGLSITWGSDAQSILLEGIELNFLTEDQFLF